MTSCFAIKALFMTDYNFYADYLIFFVNKTADETFEIKEMMGEIAMISKVLKNNNSFLVLAKNLRVTARAFAGVAGFLQQHILPEVLEAKNNVGEVQVRWVIDTSMSIVTTLISHAELTKDKESFVVMLPVPPAS
jgi:hypothetical protein